MKDVVVQLQLVYQTWASPCSMQQGEYIRSRVPQLQKSKRICEEGVLQVKKPGPGKG